MQRGIFWQERKISYVKDGTIKKVELSIGTLNAKGDSKADDKNKGKAKEKTPTSNPEDFTKQKGDQGYKDKKGNTWKKDKLHKDHWDISNKKGQKIREVDFNGNEIWPNGPKNKNK